MDKPQLKPLGEHRPNLPAISVSLPHLLSFGFLKPGETLYITHNGVEREATLLSDGRIEIGGGHRFWSLASAVEAALEVPFAAGWDSCYVERDGQRVSLWEIRRRAINEHPDVAPARRPPANADEALKVFRDDRALEVWFELTAKERAPLRRGRRDADLYEALRAAGHISDERDREFDGRFAAEQRASTEHAPAELS